MALSPGLIYEKQRGDFKNQSVRMAQLRLGKEGGFPTSAILVGAGSSSDRIETATANAHFLDFYLSFSATTGTCKGLYLDAKLTGTDGTLRALEVQAEYSGTDANGGVTCYAIRGYAKLSGSSTGSSWHAGVQGKFEVSGTIGSGTKACAVLAQINASAGTLSSGAVLYGLWIDNQLTSKGNATLYMLGIENTVAGVVADAMFWCYGKATNWFMLANGALAPAYLSYLNTAPAAATGSIKIDVDGTAYYVLVTTDPTA